MRQTNFGAGELDPLLQGRSDLPMTGRGLRTCRNFFITRHGAAMSRPGSTYVAEAKNGVTSTTPSGDPDGLDSGRVRLLPYVYSDSLSYVLEFGNNYLRLHTLGRPVMSGGSPYEVSSPFSSDRLPTLKFAQVGAVMTIVDQVWGSCELKIIVDPTTSAPTATFTAVSFTPDTTLFCDTDNGTVTSEFGLVLPAPAVDADHPEREWKWLVTAVVQDPVTGDTYQTLGREVTREWDGLSWDGGNDPLATDKYAVFADRPVTLKRGDTGSGVTPDYRVLAYMFYRGRGGVYGYVGSTTGREFIDDGREPDFAVQPPLGTDPFTVRARNGTIVRVETPLTVAFFQSRRVFGGTYGGVEVSGLYAPVGTVYGRPATLFASAVDDFYNFDSRQVLHVSGEALLFGLLEQKRVEIRHLVPRDRLLFILTDGNVGTFGGVEASALDFDSVEYRVVDDVGASHVRPLVIDGSVLWVRTKGFGARAMVPNGGAYAAVDVSAHAKHLFIGSGRTKHIVDWCYQEDPWGIAWAVRSDGVLMSLTPAGQELVAWARHDTDGLYESICSVPEGEEDAVYAVVRRNINGGWQRYIERFTSRMRRQLDSDSELPEYLAAPTAEDTEALYPTDVCVDCAFTYAGPPATFISLSGLEALNHKDVYVLIPRLGVIGPVRVQGTPGTVDLELDDTPEPNAVDDSGVPIMVAYIGLKFTCDLETLSIRGELTPRQKTIKEVAFEVDNAKGLEFGQDFDNLTEWEQRDVDDSYAPVSSDSTLVVSPVDNIWDRNSRAVLRQDTPRPVTVVALHRNPVVGDD